MREFKKLPLELFIGYDIEQNSRVIELDASEMVEKYPSGILQLVCKRPGEETTYIAPSFEQDGGTLRWTLTSYDVEKAGQGLAIVALVDTSEESVKVLASHKIRTGIEEGLHFRDAETVDPEDSLIARVLAAVSQAQAYAQDAAEALGDVQDEHDQAIADIEAKGAETLASIPSDYTTLSGDVSDLKSAFEGEINYTTVGTYNLLDFSKIFDGVARIEIQSPYKIKLTATTSGQYNFLRFIFPVSGVSKIKVTFAVGESTGSARVRLGYSNDGNTFGGWINTVNSGQVFDVSTYSYIVVALYATWTINLGEGNYVVYENVMVVAGEETKDYLPAKLPVTSDETVDIRTGFDDTVYNTAGEAVRTQISNLNDRLSPLVASTINLFDADQLEWTSSGADLTHLADGKTLRLTSSSEGKDRYSYCNLSVAGINSIFVQSDTCICSIPYQTTTPRIRIGKLNDDLSFNSWIGDTQFGKAIDVSECNYIRVALYASYAVSSPAGTYVDYTNVMISNGDIRKPYIKGGLTAVDIIARSPFEIPSYYFTNNYLENKITRINELCAGCMGNGDAFIFMTDQHWRLNAQNSPALVKYIYENTNISRMFMGGDLCNGGADLEFFAANKAYQNAFGGEIDYVVGNHEYLHPSLNDNNLSYWLFMRNANRVYGDYTRHYYYIDNNAQKIRYIFLSAYQYSGSSSSSVIGYEVDQQNWLRDTALGTLNSGWTAIIITHLLYLVTAGVEQDTLSLPGNCADIANIIANYNGDGEIACVIQGHTHLDKITEVQNSGIPVIITTCDKYVSGAGSDVSDIPRANRVHATITEQAFDVVVVDKTNRKITAVRVGAPALNGVGSALGTEVEEREVSY